MNKIRRMTELWQRTERYNMKDKLLAVLDMSEDEQYNWLYQNDIFIDGMDVMRSTVAELAFRLRDEADDNEYMQAIVIVQNELVRLGKLSPRYRGLIPTNEFMWILLSKPIHWIIAALIAKENQ